MSNPLVVGIDVHRKTPTVVLMEQNGYDAIHVTAEATGWYWWHLFHTLKTCSDRDKTGRVDAGVIADRIRLGRDLPQPYAYDEALGLCFLTRHHFHLVHQLVREKTYFLAHLYLSQRIHPSPALNAIYLVLTSALHLRRKAQQSHIRCSHKLAGLAALMRHGFEWRFFQLVEHAIS